MFALLKKEISSFFASPIGYLVIAIFLLINGLFLWLFKGEYNILDYGYADLSSFFLLAPWILLFLIPAVTMRSFSDEKRQGTLELLLTKPISRLQIVLGKYLGALTLIILSLIPTLLYVYTIHQLGNPIGNLDLGSIIGSYFGLLLLIAAYTAIGIFASTLSKNQIVAFISAVFICFFFFIGLQGLADFASSTTIEKFGMNYHFQSISRGVLDTRDILYFLSITTFFILITLAGIRTEKIGKRVLVRFLIILLGLLALNIFTQSAYGRYDLTQDKRYTLSEASYNIIKDVDSPIIIDVFLEGEGFPSNIRRLQAETRQLLEEFADKNKNVKYSFINPLEDADVRDQNLKLLNDSGLTPMMLTVQENGRTSQEPIIPWALATYNGQRIEIPLIKNKLNASQESLIQSSVQHLEYAFSDGFSKLIFSKQKKVAILKGNGQLEDRYLANFLTTLGDYYFIAPFTLDSVSSAPQNTLDKLKDFDLIISAKPTEAFSETEKLVLDQYAMNGGKSLWLVDKIAIDKDSLLNDEGSNIAIARDLNLTDFFFKYGVRINPVLVNDVYSDPINLAIGEGSEAQFQPIQWQYSPLSSGNGNHAITTNLDLVRLDFANQIDTLKNEVSKTILLKSSPLSKLTGTPRIISIEEGTSKPDPSTYTNTGNHNLAVLLEGEFTSVYNNRVKPFQFSETKNKSTTTKMIVVADGDIIKNEVGRNGPLELGFNRLTGNVYANKEFLLNAINYLLDDNGLINIRTKEVAIAHLNPELIIAQKTKWQIINIALPLLLLVVFGLSFNFYRKKKYAK
ncbi:gliding motility-associated ABC transporter substrate-binding protein GldG [Flavobacteriaceae bacterium AU392]|nr:gliding motility-associated ABC transporter substrate-binding protein GldG [Flavobacteriaceae bacterium]RKM85871.1 gliding motility-associated ABC transporter substrate-binding protein GldG [Flavobacteriaceae bacterium AU392]